MRYILTTAFLVFALVGSAVAEGDGGHAGAFLQVPIGARPAAMGSAYTAVSNDGAGALYNPAGLATIQQMLFATSYRVMQLDRTLGYATLMIPIEEESMLGFHWLYAGSGSVQARDSDGYELDHEFSFNNHDFSILFAKRFERYVSAGVKLNYFHATIPETSASSIGIDLGMMLYVDQLFDREKRQDMSVKDIQVGLSVKNIGAKYPWNSEGYNQVYSTDVYGYQQDDKVPVQVTLGASARFLNKKLLVASDVLKNEKQGAEFHAGAEYYIVPEFALRGGYGDKRLTAGTGYMFKFGGHFLAVDYAFSTDKADEGSEHIFSFDFLF